MKRDMDIARKILFLIEKSNTPNHWIEIEIENIPQEIISYHIKLLHQAGLIEADDLTDSSGFEWQAISLTWNGHEFLESARDEKRWNKAKKIISEKGGSLTFEILKQVLFGLVNEAIFPKS